MIIIVKRRCLFFLFFLQMEPRNRNGRLPPLPGSPTLAEFHRTPTSCRASEHDLSRCVRRVASLASSRSASTLFRYRPSLSRALRNTLETFHAYRPLHTDRANIHDFSIYFYLSFLLLWNFGKSNFPELGEMEGKTNWNCAFQRKFRSSVQMYTIRGILMFGSDTELTRN